MVILFYYSVNTSPTRVYYKLGTPEVFCLDVGDLVPSGGDGGGDGDPGDDGDYESDGGHEGEEEVAEEEGSDEEEADLVVLDPEHVREHTLQ